MESLCAKTTKEPAGTAVPAPTNPLSVYDAVKPLAFTVGVRFGFGTESLTMQRREFALSAEFSKFIRVNGYVPLNFPSGGNFPDANSWSNQDADTNVILAGAQVAF